MKDIPPMFSREGASRELFKSSKEGLLPPMTIFLLHEVERFNSLFKLIRDSLESLIKAIKGFEVFTDVLEATLHSLSLNKVPSVWALYPSLKPLSFWFQDLKERSTFIHRWLTSGSPRSYKLSAFFFPQGFLTSVL